MKTLFSTGGTLPRQDYFFILLFAAIGQGFLALAADSWGSHLSADMLYTAVGVVALPFVWVQFCATIKCLSGANWTTLAALPQLPVSFWPLWYLFHTEAPSLLRIVFFVFCVYSVALFCALLARGARPSALQAARVFGGADHSARPAADTQPQMPRVPAPQPAIPPRSTQPTAFDPVVGWLVMVEGPARGDQYRLRAQRNRIGSGPSMEVRITAAGIERDEHAIVTFDPRNNRYSLAPASGAAAIVKEQGRQAVSRPTVLQPYDRIWLNGTTVIFVPLCGPHHQWELISTEHA